jgi:hypothetical protein
LTDSSSCSTGYGPSIRAASRTIGRRNVAGASVSTRCRRSPRLSATTRPRGTDAHREAFHTKADTPSTEAVLLVTGTRAAHRRRADRTSQWRSPLTTDHSEPCAESLTRDSHDARLIAGTAARVRPWQTWPSPAQSPRGTSPLTAQAVAAVTLPPVVRLSGCLFHLASRARARCFLRRAQFSPHVHKLRSP